MKLSVSVYVHMIRSVLSG